MREPNNNFGDNTGKKGTLEHKEDISPRKGINNKGIRRADIKTIEHRHGRRYERDYEEDQLEWIEEQRN